MQSLALALLNRAARLRKIHGWPVTQAASEAAAATAAARGVTTLTSYREDLPTLDQTVRDVKRKLGNFLDVVQFIWAYMP